MPWQPATNQLRRNNRSSPRPATRCLAAFVVLAILVADLHAQDRQHADHLGTVRFPVSCSATAQEEFNRATALLHHMTYPPARVAFERVIETDSTCAMAHWGIAMTLFQPLWPTRPGPEALRRGWNAVRRARALGATSDRERMFVDAAEAFFLEPAATDYWLRIRRWEQSMRRLHDAFPGDAEASAFYALAHLATTPSDTISREHADRAAGILLRVYRQNPDHPGAMHYLVHANDVPGREQELLEITRRYESVAPDNPHALHMPTHIYTRLGDWNGVIRGNRKAAEAALATPAGEQGEFIWDEFAHALEYLVYGWLQQGADDSAASALTRLQATTRLEPTFKTAFHLASTRARYALERHAWTEAASVRPREPATLDWDRFPWAEAVSRFAHGVGAVHLGRLDEARTEARHLDTLYARTRQSGESLFARNIRVLHLELAAWIAHAGHRRDSAVSLMREAATLEVSTPKHAVTPGPLLPAWELLGDLLMVQQRPAEALAAFRRSLELHPRRFNSLLGAARAARATGDTTGSVEFYRELLAVADPASTRPGLEEARTNAAKPLPRDVHDQGQRALSEHTERAVRPRLLP